jgi:ABC-type dipeptide/oligopeptide/nickel transport system ATPase component
MVVELCERVIVLDRGEIVAQGATVDLLSDESLMLAHGLERPHVLMHRHPHGPVRAPGGAGAGIVRSASRCSIARDSNSAMSCSIPVSRLVETSRISIPGRTASMLARAAGAVELHRWPQDRSS